MTLLPTALVLVLKHAIGPISAISIIGVVFPANLWIAVWGRTFLEGRGYCKLQTFTCIPSGLIGQESVVWSIK